jgi:uncharacterized membrane protein YphA (DoxX/SURF4 family)
MAKESAARGLNIIRIALGIFFLFEAIGKIHWFTNTGQLAQMLNGYLQHAVPVARWYLETFAIPGIPIFARLVPIGEFACGLALIFGFWTRLAAALAFLMAFNFLFAGSAIFQYRFLTNPYGLPTLGSLLGLAVGGARLPWSVQK